MGETVGDVWEPRNMTITLRKGPVVLQIPSDEEVAVLADLREEGVTAPGNEHYTPNLLLGLPATVEARKLAMLQYFWKGKAEFNTAGRWDLPFAVRHNGVIVGVQTLGSTQFPARRTVRTGSWMVSSAQGSGVGTVMRAAVLEFAFRFLNAEYATTGHAEGNEASRRVSEKLGYEPNGYERIALPGGQQSIRNNRLILTAARWNETGRPAWCDEFEFVGAERCARFVLGEAGT